MRTAILILCAGLAACTTVRQLRAPGTIPATGHAQRTRSEDALDYSIATTIAAPPAVVWGILTNAAAYTQWNSTVVKLDGTIALDAEIALVSKVAPDRTFELAVTTFEPPSRMVWEDGGSMFLGVRNFTLTPSADGGTLFVMSETFSGGMLGMIEDDLPDFTESFEAFAADLAKHATLATPEVPRSWGLSAAP